MKNCFVCEKEIEVTDFVYDATIWKSHGNFGSTVFDPIEDNRHLEILICDECLQKKRGSVEDVSVRVDYKEISRIKF